MFLFGAKVGRIIMRDKQVFLVIYQFFLQFIFDSYFNTKTN